MSVLGGNPLLLGGADGDQVLPIQRSVRLRSSASAYFNRTMTTPTNNKVWTWSAWVKRGKASGASAAALHLFGTGSGSNDAGTTQIYFESESLILGGYSTPWLKSNAVYRDPSAWYHIVATWDNSNGTAANRAKLYVNGVEITYVTDNRASLSTTSTYGINQAVLHTIGAWSWNNGTFAQPEYYDGYLTEINFIDGQALTPASFGFINPTTGVWVPKLYVGTYGTNGFYLNFQDNSAATAAAIGKDSSGNGNNWTPNNINVSAYTGTPSNNVLYDSMIDTPTPYSDGGNNRGNYPTLQVNASLGNGAYTEGNLGFKSGVTGQWRGAHASMFMPSGKFYFEATIQALSGNNFFMIGACGIQTSSTLYANLTGQVANGWGVQCNGGTGGTKYNNNATLNVSNASFASWVAGSVLQCAVDVTNGRIWFGKNNVWLEGDPAAGTGASYTNLTGAIAPSVSVYGSGVDKLAVNFGQRPFSYTPPSGFVAVNTYNLPAPTIPNGATQFAATTYTGTGSVLKITTGFPVGLSWQKGRSAAQSHFLQDIVRGISAGAVITDSTAAETGAGGVLVTSFDSDGVTFNANGNTNTLNNTYISWLWKASNATAVTNTAGSITSSVSANPTAGFSIVTYTGTASAGATVGHGLGIAPRMIIVKERDDVTNWYVYHASIGNTGGLVLNGTNATVTSITLWNNTSPTSSVISLGNSGELNGLNDLYVAYCFSEIAGYSKFGSYTGNGAADGMFIYLGFRPKFFMIKSTSAGTSWVMMDSSRNTFNLAETSLYAESANSEATIGIVNDIDFLSNGFKLRNTTGFVNASQTYIYAAFAENPFNNSLAR